MKHIYLLNNKIFGSSNEAPKAGLKGTNTMGIWQQSLTELACDENELDEINETISTLHTTKPIDITSITTVKPLVTETKSGSWTDYKVYFKEVENESNESIEFAKWLLKTENTIVCTSKSEWKHYQIIERKDGLCDNGIIIEKLYEIFKNK